MRLLHRLRVGAVLAIGILLVATAAPIPTAQEAAAAPGNIAGMITPIAVGFIVGATGSYTWALLYFVGAGVLFTVSSLVIDYSRRLAVR